MGERGGSLPSSAHTHHSDRKGQGGLKGSMCPTSAASRKGRGEIPPTRSAQPLHEDNRRVRTESSRLNG